MKGISVELCSTETAEGLRADRGVRGHTWPVTSMPRNGAAVRPVSPPVTVGVLFVFRNIFHQLVGLAPFPL
jgi:hypothetical protein